MPDLTKQMMRYSPRLFTLIPLHKPKDLMRLKGGKTKPVGKAPVHNNWTTREYNSEKVRAAAIRDGRNIGVRLTEEQLVIDVDPRNGGADGFLSFCADIGFDAQRFPRVVTGSGGFHVYMTKPADLLIRDTLESEDYNGVEFKSKGRQVVAAGSIHPNGKPYLWDDQYPNIKDGLPPAPRKLLKAITRPPRGEGVTSGGQYSQEQIAEALSKLDVHEFNTNDKWFQLMQACHHATAGEGRSEFLDWSTSDPAYAADAYMIGKRWDSLHADKNDGVTYKTLNMILRNNGAAGSQAAPSHADVSDDFDDDIEDPDPAEFDDGGPGEDIDFDTPDDDSEEIVFESNTRPKLRKEYLTFDEPEDGVRNERAGGWSEESVTALDVLNETYLCMVENGKFKIMYKEADPIMDGRERWLSMERNSFESLHANHMIERDMTGLSRNAQTQINIGEAWIKWPDRRTVKGVTFEPGENGGEVQKPGWLNLWNGYAYKYQLGAQKRGSWSSMQEMIFECIADRDQRVYDYLINWMAFMVQKPRSVCEAAVVLRGPQGAGKGTLGNALVKLIGQHAHAVSTSEQLTGRFNDHMRNLIFLFADEGAISAYDRVAEAKLKNLITEPMISIEKKGHDLQRLPNLLHVMMASNEKWVIPAAADERRYMVQNVSGRWVGLRAKWQAIQDQMNADGGTGFFAMMADLVEHEFPEPDWHPRVIPVTQALQEQKIYSFSPLSKYFYNQLLDRQLPFMTESPWAEGDCTFYLDDFQSSFAVWCRSSDIKAGSAGRSNKSQLMAEIAAVFPTAKINERRHVSDERLQADDLKVDIEGRALAVTIPCLETAAREFEKVHGLTRGTLGNFKTAAQLEFG